jgi:murein L,D-transpeptidase YafK
MIIIGFFGCLWDADSALSQPVMNVSQDEFRIVIHCSINVLQLWRKNEAIREYPIETGKGGLGKHRSGDHCTPLGDYEVSWMASRNSAKGHRIVENRSWCKGNRFIHADSGPSLEKLWAESYGGDEATVISINYPNAKDRLRGFTGDCIHIHADKKLKDGMLTKSYGCIHMFPKDAMELYEMVEVGTPVKILP